MKEFGIKDNKLIVFNPKIDSKEELFDIVKKNNKYFLRKNNEEVQISKIYSLENLINIDEDEFVKTPLLAELLYNNGKKTLYIFSTKQEFILNPTNKEKIEIMNIMINKGFKENKCFFDFLDNVYLKLILWKEHNVVKFADQFVWASLVYREMEIIINDLEKGTIEKKLVETDLDIDPFHYVIFFIVDNLFWIDFSPEILNTGQETDEYVPLFKTYDICIVNQEIEKLENNNK